MVAERLILCFDLDGPILDVAERYYQIYLDLLRELSAGRTKLTALSKDKYWQRKRARISEDDILAAAGNADRHIASAYTARRRERLEAPEYLKFDRPWPGMIESLRVAAQKFEIIVATLRSSRAQLLEQIDGLGLAETFSAIVSAPVAESGAGRGEAKARLLREAYGASRAGWFIGDTETDIVAGKALGWQTAAVAFGIRNEEILAKSQPDLLLRRPHELIEWIERLQ